MALPVMVWGVRRATTGRPDWLVVSVYAWYFLCLATLQVRFVGELATFVALFAGYAFVWLAGKIEVARPLVPDSRDRVTARIPEARTLASLGLLFLLVGSLGIVQVPVKTSQVTTEAGTYQTAMAINESATGQEYPANYVLSGWGDSRTYNYFVNGESESYGYARENYAAFISARDGEAWYERLRGRVGYVVTRDRDAGPQTIQTRLHDRFGSRSSEASGLGHYRAIYTTESESHRAFQLVPGAVIEGTASPGATVTATTTVSIPNLEFEYTRQTEAAENGSYRMVVANSGTYTIETGDGTETVSVNQSAVQNGTSVAVGSR